MRRAEEHIADELASLRVRIREARRAQRMTQQDLAHRTQLNQRTVSAIETGKIEPSLKTLLVILGVLGLGLGVYLLSRKKD